MSAANPGWGAPRIHGELGKLGIKVSETTVAKYMVRQRRPPSQTWRTFLNHHVKDLASADFFVVPTARFRLLFVFVILSHDRRRPVHFAVTSHPTGSGRPISWCKRSLGTALRVFCCMIATVITETYFEKPPQGWVFRKFFALRAPLGRTRMPSG